MVHWWTWAAFVAALIALLGVDLARHDDDRAMPVKEALAWTGLWVGLGVAFGILVWAWRGGEPGGEYLAGYLIEWSLSVDNVFVWILIFSHFAVPRRYQHRVLFWGVLGAIVMRLSFILGGAALLNRFHWIVYVFGALLLLTAGRMLRERSDTLAPEDAPALRALRRLVPISSTYDGHRLVSRREDGTRVATPLLAVLVLIESADLVFAVDSIPAVFSVTKDAFIAFTSNAMAILGLRSLFFVLSGAVTRVRYLRPALVAILVFVGVKMLLSSVVEVPVAVSLGIIVAILAGAVVASLIAGRQPQTRSL
jgi:tellurite resistance protein TerC